MVDNAFGAELARQMRDEVAGLAHEARMHRNATHLVKAGETEFLCEFLTDGFHPAPAPAPAREGAREREGRDSEETTGPLSRKKNSGAGAGGRCAGGRPGRILNVPEGGRRGRTRPACADPAAGPAADKEQILEAELDDVAKAGDKPVFAELARDRSLLTMAELGMTLGLHRQAVKLQYNAGAGGCFPMHFDSDQELDPRVLTAVVYLNAEWQDADGGLLKLYPTFNGEEAITVQPIADRMALFSSPHMLHRVLPSAANRFCFSIWFHARKRPPNPGLGAEGPPDPDDLEGTWKFLSSRNVRKHVMKALYADEWETSIRESHADSTERGRAIDTHREEVALIKRALGKYWPTLMAGIGQGRAEEVQWFV